MRRSADRHHDRAAWGRHDPRSTIHDLTYVVNAEAVTRTSLLDRELVPRAFVLPSIDEGFGLPKLTVGLPGPDTSASDR